MQQNKIIEALTTRKTALGTLVQMNSPEIAEMASAAGFDFIYLDMEHTNIGIDALANLIRAVQAGGNAAPIVRPPDASPEHIGRILDAGAYGLIIPGIDNAEQMADIVAAAHYGPTGRRGACPAVRANFHGVRPWPEYAAWARDNIFICGVVETERGFNEFDDIIAIEGVNAIAIGMFDLAVAMGRGGDYNHPDVVARFVDLAQRARSKNVDVMGAVMNYRQLDPELKRLRDAGVNIVIYPGDRFLLSSIFRDAVATLSHGPGDES